MKVLKGMALAGSSATKQRVENDFYATDPLAVSMLMDAYSLDGEKFLEPCVGNGNIANTVVQKIGRDISLVGVDLVDRGYKNTVVCDFLDFKSNDLYDVIISNPPYSLAQQFIEKSFSLIKENGKIIMFLKIQFLEGDKRRKFFQKYPPKYIYVFSKRMPTWNNGERLDKNGKRWATTMCHAWFVWEEGFSGSPSVCWL